MNILVNETVVKEIVKPDVVLDFWFNNSAKWFDKDSEFDLYIREYFFDLYNQAMKGELDGWKEWAKSLLALIIVLDQFPRNMFRNTAKAYSGDEKALFLVHEAIYLGMDKKLEAAHRKVFYMPLMHSESLNDQELSVTLYGQLNDKDTLKYAEIHREIITRYNRFPHRNKVLGRNSTHEELEFLKESEFSF